MRTAVRRGLWGALALVLVLLLLEGTTRVFFAVRQRDPAVLLAPHRTRAAMELTRAEPLKPVEGQPRERPPLAGVKARIREAGRLPPGPCRFMAADGSAHVIQINASGFRGKEVGDCGDARFLLVTLGGSSTFCAECPEGTSWPERLERRLNEGYGSNVVCVVNRAMLGMNPHQVAELFETEIAALAPDLVLVCSAFNAIDPPLVVDLSPGRASALTRLLWGRSLLFTTFHAHRGRRRDARSARERMASYEKDLRRMVRTARDHAIPLAFVLQPMLDPRRQTVNAAVAHIPAAQARRQLAEMRAMRPMQSALLTRMAEVAHAAGVPVCDPRRAVTEGASADENFVLSLHLTPRGADKMARALAVDLRALLPRDE